MTIANKLLAFKKSLPFELFVGMRYTRAKRRNHFISFISMTSMIGIGLGVAALIVVLSVMNGFQEELRSRILGVASHIQITGPNNALNNWQEVADAAQPSPHVVGVAPYIMAQGMLSNGQAVQGAIVRGVLPSDEGKVSDLAGHMRAGQLADLKAGFVGCRHGGIGQKNSRSIPQRSFGKILSTMESANSGCWCLVDGCGHFVHGILPTFPL